MAVGPEISEMLILGSVAQSAALGAAIIGLSSIPSTHAAWKIDPPKDDPAATHDSKRGFLTAKAGDRQSEAVLEITCARGGQQLFVSTSTDLRDTIEVRYRIDDRPQKQSVFDIYDPNSVSIRNPLPAEIGFAKRLRLEFIRNEAPSLLFNFDTAGANGVVNAIRC
jgi:hypothetical protein